MKVTYKEYETLTSFNLNEFLNRIVTLGKEGYSISPTQPTLMKSMDCHFVLMERDVLEED